MLDFLAANNANRSTTATKLLSRLNKRVCPCRRSAISSDEKHDLLSRLAAVGDAFICFHFRSPLLCMRVSEPFVVTSKFQIIFFRKILSLFNIFERRSFDSRLYMSLLIDLQNHRHPQARRSRYLQQIVRELLSRIHLTMQSLHAAVGFYILYASCLQVTR